MKTRSAIFLTLSLIVHAICITALALSHFKNLEAPQGGTVEVAMGETASTGEVDANVPTPQVEPLVEKIVEKEVIKPQPKKPVAKPQPKKGVKATPPTELPKKEQQDAAVEKIENMSPEIDSEDAVAISPDKIEADKVEMVPVKDAIAGVEAASDESQTEAQVEATEQQDKVQSEEATETSEIKATATSSSASPAGASRANAVSYLNLQQYGGNQIPEYPIRARQEGRQGQVDLLYRVTSEGRIAEIQIVKSSGHSDLDEAAIKAIAKYRYVPGQEGWARHPIVFKLNDKTTESAAAN